MSIFDIIAALLVALYIYLENNHIVAYKHEIAFAFISAALTLVSLPFSLVASALSMIVFFLSVQRLIKIERVVRKWKRRK